MRPKQILIGIAGAGLVTGLLLMSGAAAWWRDAGTAEQDAVTTGTLSLTNGDGTTMSQNYEWTAMTASNMRPGHATTQPLMVENDGNVAVRYRLAEVTWTNDDLPLTATADGIRAWNTLEPGARETWSITITLDPDADNAAQGQRSTGTFVFEARQAKHVPD